MNCVINIVPVRSVGSDVWIVVRSAVVTVGFRPSGFSSQRAKCAPSSEHNLRTTLDMDAYE